MTIRNASPFILQHLGETPISPRDLAAIVPMPEPMRADKWRWLVGTVLSRAALTNTVHTVAKGTHIGRIETLYYRRTP